MTERVKSLLGDSSISRVEYRGLNSYLYYFGVPYYNYSLMGPNTLFELLRPLYYCATG